MSSNKIPNSYDPLLSLSGTCYTGALRVGGSVPLVINTSGAIEDDLDALLGAQGPYEQSRAGLKSAYETYHEVLEAAYQWSRKTRDYLRQYLGYQFNNAWVPAGFRDSLAIRRSEPFLNGLVASLAGFFTVNEGWQDEPHGITAAQAQALRGGILEAKSNVYAARTACATAKEPRDAAFQAMRKRLSGLVGELKQRLGPDDPRWLDFGLNKPGSRSTPETPENLTAVSYAFGQIFASCDESPRATHYRFYTQISLEQPEPVFAGHSTEPSLLLTDLEPDQLYQVFVSAANESGESPLSEPVEAIPQALAKAA